MLSKSRVMLVKSKSTFINFSDGSWLVGSAQDTIELDVVGISGSSISSSYSSREIVFCEICIAFEKYWTS